MAEATLVYCEWHDAHSDESWIDVSEIDAEPYPVRSAGWLIADAKPGHVTLAQSCGPDGALDGVIYIPTGMVTRLVALHPPRGDTDSLP